MIQDNILTFNVSFREQTQGHHVHMLNSVNHWWVWAEWEFFSQKEKNKKQQAGAEHTLITEIWQLTGKHICVLLVLLVSWLCWPVYMEFLLVLSKNVTTLCWCWQAVLTVVLQNEFWTDQAQTLINTGFTVFLLVSFEDESYLVPQFPTESVSLYAYDIHTLIFCTSFKWQI